MAVDAEVAQSFAKLGVDVEAQEDDSETYHVWRENWDIVVFFLQCETQLRGIAVRNRVIWTGFDYAGIRAKLDFRSRRKRRRLFEGVCVMEREAVATLAEIANG